eukprot:TRINITY_DN2643_c0_g3_i1.p1 TRINITY_DN2643_c0_g3~~TRINITY_DN2643_c0_g3_i1.p1  ORF type:complete len:303 (+),score=85.21 TRINITY_DN2643_c0_g3_i1:824-1732(+)
MSIARNRRRRLRCGAGSEYPIPGATTAGIDAALDSATVALKQTADSELSNADYTSTVAGALLSLAFTMTGVIAAYAGRKEIIFFFYKFLSLAGAKAVTSATFVFVIVGPASLLVMDEISVRQGNPDGTATSIEWVQGQGQGNGAYKIVGAIAMRFEAQYSAAATAIVYANLVLAVVGGIGTCIMVWRTREGVVRHVKRRAPSGGACGAPAARAAAAARRGRPSSRQTATPSTRAPRTPPAAPPPTAAGASGRAVRALACARRRARAAPACVRLPSSSRPWRPRSAARCCRRRRWRPWTAHRT